MVPNQVWNSGPAIIAIIVVFAAEGFFLFWLGRILSPFLEKFLSNQKCQTEAMTTQSAAITKLVTEMGVKKQEDENSHQRITLILKVLDQKLDDLLDQIDSEKRKLKHD